ncbi:tumor necrosis factor receptor superfamily member 11B [Biomphalaria pfeifferi]|uniref:Tumor necrosis factor receptor superfamily member 11B n=1 Tax=Biomphalaria pfeifferi TaxID=112525 RepID=A0AAD8C4I5_BIOPF|nr:tumor necrosis factor receptor superfamily member 11B [Biomphalaria pfeifferi]
MISNVCGGGALYGPVYRIIFQPRKRSAHQNCSVGQFFSDSLNQCQTCSQGTFRTESMARDARLDGHCQVCDIADDTAIVRHPCNATSNAVIGCMEKYYKVRREDNIYQCKACSTCGLGADLFRDFEVRRCTEEVDALCCYEAHDVLWKGQCTHRDDVPVTTTSTHLNWETQPTVVD